MTNRVSFLMNALPAPMPGAALRIPSNELPEPPTTFFSRREWGTDSMVIQLPQPLDVKLVRQPDGLLLTASCRCGGRAEWFISGLTAGEEEVKIQQRRAMAQLQKTFVPAHEHDAAANARATPEDAAHAFVAAVTTDIAREGVASVIKRLELHLLLSSGRRAIAIVPALPSFSDAGGHARVAASVAFAYGVRSWLDTRSLRAVAALFVSGGTVSGKHETRNAEGNPALIGMLVTRTESLAAAWRGVRDDAPGVSSWAWSPGISPYLIPGIVTQ